ncbi:uncharacterized protein AMSG_07215 [Thecamonas trahens ATCC 50062]|uniref:Uncharacterized protein n=1 Tax=Thecamonas trahens ATCC 50062 TaxID=461836 RepID=A0A0L0DFF5_THETB|nr:hypothetical protein AMSG_07215 [Thecamonas trahens ATCC 50062]KNC50960.1 hypothetical protein AMSG_07215 [Thecamonas trahens ATCC 50062]|eukprot:XP_013756656.1 hypothetical protein AMSG_07215 [Thecamonas trahens ATCC 50062]
MASPSPSHPSSSHPPSPSSSHVQVHPPPNHPSIAESLYLPRPLTEHVLERVFAMAGGVYLVEVASRAAHVPNDQGVFASLPKHVDAVLVAGVLADTTQTPASGTSSSFFPMSDDSPAASPLPSSASASSIRSSPSDSALAGIHRRPSSSPLYAEYIPPIFEDSPENASSGQAASELPLARPLEFGLPGHDGSDDADDDDDDFVLIDSEFEVDAGELVAAESSPSTEAARAAARAAASGAVTAARAAGGMLSAAGEWMTTMYSSAVAPAVASSVSSSSAVVAAAYEAVRNPFTGAYTANEKRQMAGVLSLYAEHFPLWLRMDASFDHPHFRGVKAGDVRKAAWIKRMGSSLLRPVAEEFVTLICAYQEERLARVTGSGYPDDPTHCVLTELKAWARDSLSHMAPGDETHQVLRARTRYLNGLLESRLFPPGRTSRTSMAQLLLSLVSLLEERVLPVLEAHAAKAAAREHLTALGRHASAFLHRLVLYLFYIVRDTPAPRNVAVAHLLGAVEAPAELAAALSTASGEALALLLAAPLDRLGEGSVTVPRQTLLAATAGRGGRGADVLATSTLTPGGDTSALGRMPVLGDSPASSSSDSLSSALALAAASEVLALPARTSPTEFVATCSARHAAQAGIELGVAHPFREDAVMHALAFVHVTAQELALLAHLFARAQALTGAGGELLLYGLARDQLERLLDAALQLVAAMGVHLETLNTHTRAYSRRMVRERISDKASLAWRQNYDEVAHVRPLLQSSLDSFADVVGTMRAALASYNLSSQLSRAQSAAAAFVAQAESFVHDTSVLIESAVSPM